MGNTNIWLRNLKKFFWISMHACWKSSSLTHFVISTNFSSKCPPNLHHCLNQYYIVIDKEITLPPLPQEKIRDLYIHRIKSFPILTNNKEIILKIFNRNKYLVMWLVLTLEQKEYLGELNEKGSFFTEREIWIT